MDSLQRLVDHKNSIGVSTMVMTTEEIYSDYSEGRDDPEKIKLCIYDMKETYDISYVLLFGGRKGQSFNWYVPERRTNNDDGWESGYSSDLYYGDIYKVNGDDVVFEDWDPNGDNIIAEWTNKVGHKDKPILILLPSIGSEITCIGSHVEPVILHLKKISESS